MAHIYHLYENFLLTFGELKDILKKASDGQLSVFEKTDGQNILLSYSIKNKKAMCARTKKDIIKSYYTVGKIYPMMYRHGENKFGIVQDTMNAFDFLFTGRTVQSIYKDLDSYVEYDILEVYRYDGEDGTLHIVGDYSVDLL
jgi:hypothetical protein